MRLVIFTTVLIFLMLTVLPGILSLGIRKLPSGFQPSLNDSQAVDKDISLNQSFRQQNNNLSGIGLSIKNPYYRNSQDLFFELYDDQNQKVRSVKLNGKNIADGNYLIISFEPITDSADKSFSFSLKAPDVSSAQSLEVYHSQQPSWDNGTYFVNGQIKDGMVSFVAYSTPSNITSTPILIYRQWLIKLFLDLPFFVFYSTVVILCLGYLLMGFKKERFS